MSNKISNKSFTSKNVSTLLIDLNCINGDKLEKSVSSRN